jgi:hypothetical protein
MRGNQAQPTAQLAGDSRGRHPLYTHIRTLIDQYPKESRRKLSVRVCAWLEAQLKERRTEPNSGLGEAIGPLTLLLRRAAAPLDNNIAERALKREILHRTNALFYRTLHGAQVGDLFMSLIHTCQLCGANSFDYLVDLQRHAQELAARPAEWMPWNYRETLGRSVPLLDSAEL